MIQECYSPRLDQALLLAASAFRHHRRKCSSTPYLAHLLQVMVYVAEHGGNEDQLITALLHDYLEDIHGGSVAELTRQFGPQVASWVDALSDSRTHPKPPWRARKERHLRTMEHAPAEVKLVWASDKLHNLETMIRDYRTFGEGLWGRFNGGREGTLWYYGAAYEVLSTGWRHPILAAVADRLDTLRKLVEQPVS